MSRAYSNVEHREVGTPFTARIETLKEKSESADGSDSVVARPRRNYADAWMLRVGLAAVAVALCYSLKPFGLYGLAAVGAGLLLAAIILVIEMRLRWATSHGLLGGALGAVLGIFAAVLVTAVVSRMTEPAQTKSFFEGGVLVAFAYLGAVLGSQKAVERETEHAARENERAPIANDGVTVVAQEGDARPALVPKLVDTSVLIDGRIAEICEAHFLDGPLIVPEFVLHELQLVADSGDALKRQRGRRGLDVLDRMQRIPGIEVRVLESSGAAAGDVDRKLVETAREMGAKIVTNDFNLNKVARVHGLTVLNVNQLANALKPVMMAGEPMRVLILREGKEANQGVAYLDDGTMVVVDGARRYINKSVDVVVTSVHQTAAGKMIFGRVEEKSYEVGLSRAAAAGATRGGESTSVRSELTDGEAG
jgi:uncharacterized protein YacL